MPEIIKSCASLSWIDPETGLPEVDHGGHPGASINRKRILGEKVYRFSNFLEAAITIDDNGQITGTRFTTASGMYRSPSFLGTSSVPVGKIGRDQRIEGAKAVFRQVVGCRTAAAEKIGARAGAGVGGAGGAYVGAKIGVLGGLPGVVIGGALGAAAGWFIGEEVGELAKSFPPIWTEVELVINVDGTTSEKLISESLFPSCTFYRQSDNDPDQYTIVGYYNAVPALSRWEKHGWSDAPRVGQRDGSTSGNPWNMVSGAKKVGGHIVNRPCPTGYACD